MEEAAKEVKNGFSHVYIIRYVQLTVFLAIARAMHPHTHKFVFVVQGNQYHTLLITDAAPAKVLAFLLTMENNAYQVHYSTSRDTKESVAGCYCILVQK